MPTSDDVMELAEACAERVTLPRRVRRYPSFAEVEEQCAEIASAVSLGERLKDRSRWN